MSTALSPTVGRRIGRQLLTVVLAAITLGFGAVLTWASLAPPRQTGIPQPPGASHMINDLPADLTWLLLIGIAIVSWRQLLVGMITTAGCAAMVMGIAYVQASRYAGAGFGDRTQLLIYVIAIIQAGSFVVVGIATGVFGQFQRSQLRRATQRTTDPGAGQHR
jgi:hypothetical protein